MKEQNAARPVWRWNAVGEEADVESEGARFCCAGVEAADISSNQIVDEETYLHYCRPQELLARKYSFLPSSYLVISPILVTRVGKAKRRTQ